RPRKIAERRCMRHQADPVAPEVELITRRLEDEMGAAARLGEVEQELVRRCRGAAGDRAGEAVVDRAVHVPAEDALDLWMPAYHRGERFRIEQRVLVHMRDRGREGR